jgi:hypothetical protein
MNTKQERIVHQDRVIEIPVERIIEVVQQIVPAPPKKIGLGVLLHRNSQSKGLTYVEDIVPVTNTDIYTDQYQRMGAYLSMGSM